MNNYDASQVGVPYVRSHKIVIDYPDSGQKPTAVIEQSLAVKLADGTVRKLNDLTPLTITIDFAANGVDPIPLVSPEDASPLGADTTLQMAFLNILAVVRQAQIRAETPN